MANADALLSHLLHDLKTACPELDFDSSDEQVSWLSPREVAVLHLGREFLSKLRDDPLPTAESRALEKFLSVNDDCKVWRKTPENLLDEHLLGTFRVEVENFFTRWDHDFGITTPIISNYGEILDNGGSGSGAALLTEGHTSLYAKMFCGELATTSHVLYMMYSQWTSEDPRWENAEYNRRLNHPDRFCSIVEGSKLSFAEKKRTIKRTICSEPPLNMRFQLGIGQIITKRLKSYFGIDLSTQPEVNRTMALRGSLDDSIATIDLSSASDSISLGLCKWVLPPEILSWLMLTRSPLTKLPNGETVELNMLSSMGNGYTFPLQTALFSCMVRACWIVAGRSTQLRCGTDWSVFGDDILCPSEMAHLVLRLLRLCGFTPNESKTFVRGPFRESCGVDCHQGVNVRPVFAKTLKRNNSLYALFNNLVIWSGTHKVQLPRTLQFIHSLVSRRLYVPVWEQIDSGFRVPMCRLPFSPRRDSNHAFRYSADCPKPSFATVLDDYIRTPEGWRQLTYNPSGLLLSFLHGTVRNGKIGLRREDDDDNSPRAVRKKVAPSWDSFPLSALSSVKADMVDWRTIDWCLSGVSLDS